MKDTSSIENRAFQASKEQSSILNFFWGVCTIILTCMSLMLLLFDSPLTGTTFGNTSVPVLILFFVSAVLALFLIRYARTKIKTHSLIISLKYIYLVCGCVAPLGLLVEVLVIPTAFLLGIGFASATFFLSLYLCDYGYSMLTIMVPVGTLIGGGFGALVYASNFNHTTIVIISALALFASWLILHLKQHSRRYDLLRISNKDSRERMTMLVDARWTYASMGLGVGFATGIAINGSVFESLNETMNAAGFGGWCFFLFIGAVIIGIFLLAIHSRLDYLIEQYTKEFYSFSITLCVLPLCFGNEIVQGVFLTLLFSVTFLQMVFIINAGVEHMRFDLLSPFWYMAENAFVLIGAIIGILLGSMINTELLPSLSPLAASSIVILLTAFAQPFINKSSYPIDSMADSVKMPPLLTESASDTPAAASATRSAGVADSAGTMSSGLSGTASETTKTALTSSTTDVPEANHAPFSQQAQDFHAISLQKAFLQQAFSPQAFSPQAQDSLADNARWTSSDAISENGDAYKSNPYDLSNAFEAHIPGAGNLEQENSETDEISHKGIWRLKIETLVAQYNLSPRQAEVFELLAKGRDAKFIEDTFMISYATAKTHIHNIYKKVDAHSRQDIIDMVERVELDQQESI